MNDNALTMLVIVICIAIFIWTSKRGRAAFEFRNVIGMYMLHSRHPSNLEWQPVEPSSYSYGRIVCANRMTPTAVEYILEQQKINVDGTTIIVPERAVRVVSTDQLTLDDYDFLNLDRFETLIDHSAPEVRRKQALLALRGHKFFARFNATLVWMCITKVTDDHVWYRIFDGVEFGEAKTISLNEFKIDVKVVA